MALVNNNTLYIRINLKFFHAYCISIRIAIYLMQNYQSYFIKIMNSCDRCLQIRRFDTVISIKFQEYWSTVFECNENKLIADYSRVLHHSGCCLSTTN